MPPMEPNAPIDPPLTASERDLILAARKLSFGEVLATVHDGAIVQLEATQKTRYPKK